MTAAVIHVVDDDDGLRKALVRLLRAHDYEVLDYPSAGHFLIALPIEAPGCVVLDLNMPGPGGLELQATLARNAFRLPIVFLTGHASVAATVTAMKAGAADLLTKPVEPERLLAAVEAALARERATRAEDGRAMAARERYATLTSREREILRGVVAGLLNKQIGARLGITERTVKAHRASLMEKTGTKSITELLDLAHLLRELD